MTRFAAALFIDRRRIDHDGTRLTIATWAVLVLAVAAWRLG